MTEIIALHVPAVGVPEAVTLSPDRYVMEIARIISRDSIGNVNVFVHPTTLPKGEVIWADQDGVQNNLPPNPVASRLAVLGGAPEDISLVGGIVFTGHINTEGSPEPVSNIVRVAAAMYLP